MVFVVIVIDTMRVDAGNAHQLLEPASGVPVTTEVHRADVLNAKTYFLEWQSQPEPSSVKSARLESSAFSCWGAVWHLIVERCNYGVSKIREDIKSPTRFGVFLQCNEMHILPKTGQINFAVFAGSDNRVLIPLRRFFRNKMRGKTSWGARHLWLSHLMCDLTFDGNLKLTVVLQMTVPNNDLLDPLQTVSNPIVAQVAAQFAKPQTFDVTLRARGPQRASTETTSLETIHRVDSCDVRANRFVLAMRSSVLHLLFYGPDSVGGNTDAFADRKSEVVDVPEASVRIVRTVVKFAYACRDWWQEIVNGDDALDLFCLAAQWQMPALIEAAVTLFTRCSKTVTTTTAIRALEIARLHIDVADLKPRSKRCHTLFEDDEKTVTHVWRVGDKALAPWKKGALYLVEILTLTEEEGKKALLEYLTDGARDTITLDQLKPLQTQWDSADDTCTFSSLAGYQNNDTTHLHSLVRSASRLLKSARRWLAVHIDQVVDHFHADGKCRKRARTPPTSPGSPASPPTFSDNCKQNRPSHVDTDNDEEVHE